MSSLLPEDLTYLRRKMSMKRIEKLEAEFDEPLQQFADKIGPVRVIEYLDKIDRIKAPPLGDLAAAIGKSEVARFLSHTDNYKYLEDPTLGNFLTNRPGAVLLKPDIECLCDKNNMVLPLIDPLDKKSLDAASYKLRLGSQFRVKGKHGWLSKSNPELTIPPHGIAIVSTFEWVNIPCFLIARWNLRVTKVYEGLVWVGSLQVDPGYQGFLSCPLYNLSKEPQVIEYGKGLFTVDFVVTTPFDKSKDCKVWEPPEGNRLATFDFSRLDKKKIESAPEYLKEEVDGCKEELDSLRGETRTAQFVGAVVLAIVVAALGILVTFGVGTDKWTSDTFLIILAAVALAISIIAIYISIVFRRPGKKGKN